MSSRFFRDRLHGVVELWKNSFVFRAADSQISHYFQRKLVNDEFSILCSNCIGGVIYHRLGKKFLSPTVNMYFSQPDFVQFCVNLDYYLAQELQFIETELPHPVAKLVGDGEDIPDITLYFNHDHDPEVSNAKWTERKRRINRENLYIILYNLDGVTVEQLKQLDSVSCKNKVVLTGTPLPEISWSVFIEPVLSHQYAYSYLEKDIVGMRYFEKIFDFVEFLNQ